MIQTVQFKVSDFSSAVEEIKKHWAVTTNKIIVLKADQVPSDVQSYYENIFKYLGTPYPLAEDVQLGSRETQRSGKIWFEVRYDPKHPNAYRHSSNAQPLHTDGSYIAGFPSSTLLACVANAGEGGETTFIDSQDVYNILKEEDPELLEFLLHTKIRHTRSGDTREDEIIRVEGDDIFVNYNYYCIDANIDPKYREKIDQFQNLLLTSSKIKDATVGVKLSPGDGIFWKDNYCLHGRNSFIANQESERFLWKCAIDILQFN